MAETSDDRHPVERLAEEFVNRHRRGERPSLTEYADRYPELADEIRNVFPALALMEGLKPGDGDVTGSLPAAGQLLRGQIPGRLGDFRILREVGRGGMGIVYEAAQESLGRHVALKVLPSQALLDPRHLQRFLREARSAARLHHTNIVPVFGVGESHGFHYYAMQFIVGTGLHDVVIELRRLRECGGRTPAAAATDPSTRYSRQLAQGLLSGAFGDPLADAPTVTAPVPPPAPSDDASPSACAPGATLPGTGRVLALEVARVGHQVAEALGYAHAQGVLHRDIKPSNLLLDVQGTVWVADFGLAKALDDGDDLTNEGDLLGTLRYMAPERFSGRADARCDLYALGLTLYELLTLRPAFDETDRGRLIHQVTHDIPPRPRHLNPVIPRDLETIVLKAIEHDPARRYQSAGELAEDLRRFLAELPIKARRVGACERAWKWAQRKPVVAGLLAALSVVLVAGFAGVAWQWREAVVARNAARVNETRARSNLRHALDTVDRFCTQVSEEELLDRPGMRPLRARLLRLALEYYSTFQRQQGSDPVLLNDLALTFLRSGTVTAELGDPIAAHVTLLHAKDILEELRVKRPDDVVARLTLVRCLIEMEDVNRLENSVILYSPEVGFNRYQAVTLMEPLVAADPGNPEYLRLLGRSHDAHGMYMFRRGRYESAAGPMEKAVSLLERAVELRPDDPEGSRWLAQTYADLGLVYQQTGHGTERVRSLERSLATTAKGGPGRRSARRRLEHAQLLAQLGAARNDVGAYRAADACLRDAGDELARLLEGDPDSVDVRYWLADVRYELGRAALTRNPRAAEDWFRKALATYQGEPSRPPAIRDLLTLARSTLGLGRSRLQSGRLRPGEAEQCDAEVRGIMQHYDAKAGYGSMAYEEQSRTLAGVRNEARYLLALSRATTAAERRSALEEELGVRRRMADEHRGNRSLRFENAAGLVDLADLMLGEGRADEARASLGTALPALGGAADDNSEDLRWQEARVRAWEVLARLEARAGRPVAALDAADRAVARAEHLARTDPSYWYELACALSVRAAVRPSESDAREALTALRKAIETGFDNDLRVRTDPRLEPLRSRGEFPGPSARPG